MSARRRLNSIVFRLWPDMTALLAEWKAFIERCDSWSWGPGFHVHDGESGRTVNYDPEPPLKYARTTEGGITARSGSTLGQGTIVLEERSGATVGDGAEELCFSAFTGAIPHPTNLIVGWDGSAYAVIGAQRCPDA